jgi:hypothetical protein
MTDIGDSTTPIQIEGATTRRPVSESLVQGIGGAINKLFKRPGLGTIVSSALSLVDFQAENGPGWVLCDGSSIVGSDLHSTYGVTNAPYRPYHNNVDTDTTHTFSGASNTNTTYSGRVTRFGRLAKIWGAIRFTGVPNFPGSTDISFSRPSGLTFKTMGSVPIEGTPLGVATIYNPSGGTPTMDDKAIVWSSTTAVKILGSTGDAAGSRMRQNVPVTFGNGDAIWLDFIAPINEWDDELVDFIRINY